MVFVLNTTLTKWIKFVAHYTVKAFIECDFQTMMAISWKIIYQVNSSRWMAFGSNVSYGMSGLLAEWQADECVEWTSFVGQAKACKSFECPAKYQGKASSILQFASVIVVYMCGSRKWANELIANEWAEHKHDDRMSLYNQINVLAILLNGDLELRTNESA